jgi:hypothetical protein
VAVELIGLLLTFVSSGMFGFFYWILPLTQVINAVLSHFGIFNFLAALAASTVITVVSILFGGGLFRARPKSYVPSGKKRIAT